MTKKTDAPLPYYKWYWQDWRSNRAVQRMSYIERGLYRELLDECWSEGGIPADMESLADICGCPVEVLANAWQVLGRCFKLVDGCYRNEKLDSLRTERDAVRVKRKDAGRLGGLRKSLNEKDSLANASQMPEVASVCHIGEERREEERIEKQSATPSVADAPTPKKRSSGKNQAKTLDDWLTECEAKDEKPIPDNDPIREWAENAGVPHDFMRLAWLVFVRDWQTKKPQADWRATFRNAVRKDWLKLWYFNADGECRLTVSGQQENKAHV